MRSSGFSWGTDDRTQQKGISSFEQTVGEAAVNWTRQAILTRFLERMSLPEGKVCSHEQIVTRLKQTAAQASFAFVWWRM